MTIPSVQDAAYPTPDECRDALLRAIRFAFARRGLVANVLPGSDHYIRAEKYASRVSIAIANNKLALADFNPLTATGDSLVTLAGVFGVTKRPAGPAAGLVEIVCTGTISIPAGFQATAPNGKKYQTVSINASIPTGTSIQIIAVSGGADTNQEAGTQLTWDSAAIGALNPRCIVGAGGLTGGADEDDDETLRRRLLDKLADPPGGGNSSQLIEFAEEATASVEAAYAYAAARGPASYDVALTKAGGNRTLPVATVSLVRGYVRGKMPGQQDDNITSVTPQGVDVILGATLPLPETAGGVGGGWRDPTPWPPAGAAVKVTAYSSITGKVIVNATTTPVAGNSIGIWDSAAQVMREYTVGTVTGTSGAYSFPVDGGFSPAPTVGAYVSTGASFLVDYAAAFLAEMEKLGPGEKTELAELLPRAARYPATASRSPSALTSLQNAAVTNQFSELGGLDYVHRYATGTTTDLSAPDVPTATADPPNILYLQEFAIVPQ